ncbi:MAG: M48 family metalloprotease [Myxococcota bacterium]
MPNQPLFALIPSLAACTVVVELPGYGDGALDCAAPDIDCFTFFDRQDAVEQWFAELEQLLAAEAFRPPRAILPSSDPRFARMRDLLERAWAAYVAVNPVADLADQTPALVLIEDPEVNAFVVPDLATDRTAFAVVVQTGLFDVESTDDALLGVAVHELEHAVRLHLIGDTKDRIRRFYVAGDPEPLGSAQADDPVARSWGEAWRTLSTEAGPYSTADLAGLPFGPGRRAARTPARRRSRPRRSRRRRSRRCRRGAGCCRRACRTGSCTDATRHLRRSGSRARSPRPASGSRSAGSR